MVEAALRGDGEFAVLISSVMLLRNWRKWAILRYIQLIQRRSPLLLMLALLEMQIFLNQ